MTSKPSSRRPRASTLAPRSCPSRPGLAIRTRIGAVRAWASSVMREPILPALRPPERRRPREPSSLTAAALRRPEVDDHLLDAVLARSRPWRRPRGRRRRGWPRPAVPRRRRRASRCGKATKMPAVSVQRRRIATLGLAGGALPAIRSASSVGLLRHAVPGGVPLVGVARDQLHHAWLLAGDQDGRPVRTRPARDQLRVGAVPVGPRS